MALNARYSTIDKAIITATGNSLIVCGDTTAKTINSSSLITPAGDTTRDYLQSGSSAKINILNSSTILYAELVWLSTVKSINPDATDLRSIQDDSITFTTPKGVYNLSPTFANSYISPAGTTDRLRAVVVTDLIKDSLSGTYTVSKVPTSIPPSGLSESRAGWSLFVVYRNDIFKPKRIVYALGIEGATPSTPLQSTLTGFKTESDEESLHGDIMLVAANGDPLQGVHTVKVGPSFANLTTIGNPVGSPNPNPGTAPNNPYNWFFTGQNNICDHLNPNIGLIDVSGTKGTLNHDAFVPTQVLGARNKWDMTGVNISNTLIPNQTQLVGQITVSELTDVLEVVAVVTEVNSSAPDITATLTAYDMDGDNEYNLEVGEPMVFSTQIKNNGKTPANNVTLTCPLDPTFTFIPNSVKINGVTQSGANITTGINIGTLEPTAVYNVVFQVKANSLPPTGTNKTTVNYSYEFTSGSGSPTYINYASTNTITTIIQQGLLTINKSVSSPSTTLGSTLVYTVSMTNVGSEIAKNVFFQDKINEYSNFVSGSVYINDVSYSSYNPNAGFSLPDLNVGQTITVKFSVKVNTLPPNTIVENGALVTFSFQFNQIENLITKTLVSNTTNIQVEYTEIMATRSSNNNYPLVGDTVTYTLKLTNIGNIPATDVAVLEPPIPGASFVNNSVYINGVNKPGYNPFTGFTIPSINPQSTATITYQVLINAIQPNELIENIAKIPFKYQISPSDPVISSEKDSNKVITRSNFVNITISETVDKAYATINDILYYTVTISNTGNIDAFNTVFLSNIQSNSSFIENSVAINGVNYPGFNPNNGFSVNTISPGNTITVTYQARVLTVPALNIIYNNSQLTYSYKPDPFGSSITATAVSNTVQTIINKASYTLTKYVDKNYAVLNDYLIYKTRITNTGTVDLKDVFFSDSLAIYLTFIDGSIYVNDTNYPDYNPIIGFPIGDVHPEDYVEVEFAVKIDSAPPYGYILNAAQFKVNYQLNPNSPIIAETKYTNQVETLVVDGNLSLVKSASKSYATIGDTINYVIEVSNTGNTTVNNINFIDAVPTATSFVLGSVYLNGIQKINFDPTIGFPIGSLTQGQVATISFDVKVNSVPIPNTIVNSASATYEYYITPAPTPPVSKTSTSNNVSTVINIGSASLTKSVDKTYATLGDTLDYTVLVNNTGTTTLTNVNFIDLVANGATIVPSSVKIDGVSFPSYNPNTGFALNNISPGGSSLVEFKVTITSLPPQYEIDNYASITFKYKISPSGSDITSSATSNTVTTYINKMNITNTKSVDKLYATLNDTLTYTSVISNSGNIPITNVNFTDILSSNLSFQSGSVKINSVSHSDFDPNIGFSLGTINPGFSVTVEFKATVSTLPNDGFVTNTSKVDFNYKINPSGETLSGSTTSNSVTTYIKLGSLSITKACNREFARISDILTYSFVIANTGNTLLQNLNFKDIIQVESSFNSGSVKVNGVLKPNLNPNAGFPLDNIPVGQYTTIEFTVTVNSIPPSGKLLNTGTVNYSYYVDPQGQIISTSKTSNETTVNINDTIVSLTKAVDKSIAKIGDEITYTITAHNGGNVSAVNVNFSDLLDPNIEFVGGSVTINGTSAPLVDPNDGFPIPDIGSNGNDVIVFKAVIKTRPDDNIVENFGTIDYQYRISPSDPYIDVTMNSNTVTTFVAYGELTVSKSVDKVYSTLNDTVNYTVSIKNTGSVNATNLSFNDLIQAGGTFVNGSVVINGTPYGSYNPNTGFSIPDLIPGAINTVSFSINVSSLPPSGKIDNFASVTFSYKLTNSDPVETKTTNSNTVTTYVNIGILSISKSVNKAYATINDNLVYNFTITNSGSVTCSNIFFKDLIQAEASFNSGSVIVNGVSKPNFNPNSGFSLDDISKGSSTTISFSVKVNSLPTNYFIYNNATANYSYYVNPSNPVINTSSTSNTVSTQINVGTLSVTKSTSKDYATIDDIVSYIITIVNTGNVVASTVNFRDVVPSGLNFVTDSVKINGVSQPGLNPYQSFTLGNILPGDSVVVRFDTIVTSLPTPSLVTNIANVIFNYKVDPNGSEIVTQTDSNPVTTQINLGQLSLTKVVDKTYATIGDTLTYTVTLNNTGNVDALNVIFTDSIQNEATFVQGSVTVNGESKPDYDPQIGFNIGTISTLGNSTVSFKVTVNSLPYQYAILNQAVGTFSYKIDPNGQTFIKSTPSNVVSTIIRVAKVSANKLVDLPYATLNDKLNYSITVHNTGNTTIFDGFFIDTLSNGGSFVPGTVLLDNVSKPTFNPIAGFNLPDLASGNTTSIKFKANVDSVPVPPQITNYADMNGKYKVDPVGPDYSISTTSNTVTTAINLGSLTNVKSVDKTYAKVNDTLTYTSVLTNTGNVIAQDVWFYDNLESELVFVSGTVRINGIVNPTLNPITGFSLGNLATNQSITVAFDVKINSLPTPPIATNKSQAQFSYKVDPNGSLITSTVLSNQVSTNVVLGNVNVTKSVDKSIATIGDVLTFSISLSNNGNVTANEILFQDTPSQGATFNPGSVILNGVPKPNFDPTAGFSIGDLAIGAVANIIFTATVTSVPSNNKVTNQAVINFKFVVDPKEPPYNATSSSNTTTTNIGYGNLTVVKSVDKQFATINENLTYTIVITNVGNIDATNVIFLDPTPANSAFVIGSVTVNGMPQPTYNPEAGFPLNTMAPGQIITVVYKVKVIS